MPGKILNAAGPTSGNFSPQLGHLSVWPACGAVKQTPYHEYDSVFQQPSNLCVGRNVEGSLAGNDEADGER